MSGVICEKKKTIDLNLMLVVFVTMVVKKKRKLVLCQSTLKKGFLTKAYFFFAILFVFEKFPLVKEVVSLGTSRIKPIYCSDRVY